MHDWLSSRLPRPLLHALYVQWYASLLVAIALYADQPVVDFYYLHG
jgi:hypothetical protein